MEPEINVGIVSGSELRLVLHHVYHCASTGIHAEGPQTFSLTPGGKIAWLGIEHDVVDLQPTARDCTFDVADVTIGVNFHWERRETQKFTGAAKIIVEGDKITLVNHLPLEDYLMSVISSEMSATANEEFLKAHAVISRSWIMAQILNRDEKGMSTPSCHATDHEIIRWYDREDHANFDVCADDHCQRYQGTTRQTTEAVDLAVNETAGMVLTDKDGELCDARFSKCCGGVFEEFENCWEPIHYHYLKATRDSEKPSAFPDLKVEENAKAWIEGAPEAFCNTRDKEILGQVLNNYDQETTDFYRWTVEYTQDELGALIKERSGIDYGKILALEPIHRGTSGRLVRLRIIGTKRTMTIGKELEIRRTLSTSHLYSSAFVVEVPSRDADGVPESFRLRGAGWGHGVGLCQIGAAVMGARGYNFRQILEHYYADSSLTKLY